MLWIILGICIIGFIISVCLDGDLSPIFFGVLGTIVFSITIVVFACYNYDKVVADRRITVLEERNSEVLEQIEPFIEQFFKYEKDSYKELKINSNTVVALSAYPELKGNEFVMKQINVVLENQKKITNLKLVQASLNGYKIWLFMGE